MKTFIRNLFAPKKPVHFTKENYTELTKINISNPVTDIDKQVKKDILHLCIDPKHLVERHYHCCMVTSSVEDSIIFDKGIRRFLKQTHKCLQVVNVD